MKTQDALGQFEQLVLTAVMAAAPDAYASAIRRKAMELGGRKLTFGSVFITLDRLERERVRRFEAWHAVIRWRQAETLLPDARCRRARSA